MILALKGSNIVKKFQLTKDIQSIELLRGIASVMVCFYHLSTGNPRFLTPDTVTMRLGSGGWAGVEIFFVISGFIIPYSMYLKRYSINDFGVFLKKRFIRIEPPYLISILLVIGLNYISTLSPYYRGQAFSVNWLDMLGHLAYINTFTGGHWVNPVYWSLALEFQYYLFVAFTYTVIVSNDRWKRIVFFVLFVALSFQPTIAWYTLFRFAPYFFAGIGLFQFVTGRIDSREFGILMIIDFIVLYYQAGIIMTLLIAATLFVIVGVDKVPALFRKLGLISYSLYLIHIPVGGRIINISEKVHNKTLREIIVYIATAVCIGFAWLFYIVVERFFKQYAGSIKYKRSADRKLA